MIFDNKLDSHSEIYTRSIKLLLMDMDPNTPSLGYSQLSPLV